MMSGAVRIATARDQRIVSRGDAADSLYVIVRGRFKVVAADVLGRQIALNVLGPQEVFGELGLVDGRVRSADVVSMTTGSLVAIDRSCFIALAKEHPGMSWTLATIVTRRLRRLTERLEDRAFLDIQQRLAKRLVEAAEDAVGGSDGHVMPGTCVTMSQRDLGEIVDASRERVNRQLVVWARDGVLQLERRRIRLVLPEALRRLYADRTAGPPVA